MLRASEAQLPDSEMWFNLKVFAPSSDLWAGRADRRRRECEFWQATIRSSRASRWSPLTEARSSLDFLSTLLVGKPFIIGGIALAFVTAYFVLRSTEFGASRNPQALLIAVGAWLAYAIWEAVVQWRTPEANIRIDLLLIWPAVAILTVLALFRALRHR